MLARDSFFIVSFYCYLENNPRVDLAVLLEKVLLYIYYSEPSFFVAIHTYKITYFLLKEKYYVGIFFTGTWW